MLESVKILNYVMEEYAMEFKENTLYIGSKDGDIFIKSGKGQQIRWKPGNKFLELVKVKEYNDGHIIADAKYKGFFGIDMNIKKVYSGLGLDVKYALELIRRVEFIESKLLGSN